MGVRRWNYSARPRVSVVIPAVTRDTLLPDAVQSVLQQTWRDLEVVIVNDGSTDLTRALAEWFRADDTRVRTWRSPTGGSAPLGTPGSPRPRGPHLLSGCRRRPASGQARATGQVPRRFPGLRPGLLRYYIGDGELTPIWLESVRPGLQRIDQWLYRNRFAPMLPLLRARPVAATGELDQTLRAAEKWDHWIGGATRRVLLCRGGRRVSRPPRPDAPRPRADAIERTARRGQELPAWFPELACADGVLDVVGRAARGGSAAPRPATGHDRADRLDRPVTAHPLGGRSIGLDACRTRG